ncbi:MAG: hypothetical protein IKM01_00565 [Clostridia bacterium]|nr:hypothetical protein [Clostridia bacterium]
MKASQKDVLTTQIYFNAAFPALRVPLEEDPKQVAKFKNVNAVVEFRAKDDENPLACYIVFLTEEMAEKSAEGKRFKVYQGEYPGYIEMADGEKYGELKVVKMYFKSIPSLLGVFKGDSPLEMLGIVAPLVKNIFNPVTLKFLFLMLTLMKTMPNFTPDDSKPWEQYLKVKLSLYLITRALSTANKLGWETMSEWTAKQPDRTYQFQVGATLDKDGNELYPEIDAYLRVKMGKSKAGKGLRKYPFVLFKFPNPDGCIAVLTGRYDFVECVERGCVEIVGAGDSYAVQFNSIMTVCQNMLVPSKLVK